MHLFNQLNKLDLILGSQSPRRKTLLEAAGFTFRTWAIPTEETFPAELEPQKIATFLSHQKAEPFKTLLTDKSILITADTIVVKDQEILNKPANARQAFQMLSLLNGTWHEVITGVCISTVKAQVSFFESTRVCFQQLTDEEIHWYIRNYQPFDKAGGYGIQEWIGMAGIEKIEGCYYNVVGLPVAALYKEIKSFVEKSFS